jgi:RNA polymerase sigma-70 factor, ECF subfamily
MDYERLVSRHKDAVYRQMVRACGNYDDAEDVLVEALLAAHKSLPQLKDEEAFRGWLAIIGRRVCSRIRKRESLRPILSLSGLTEADMEALDRRTDVEVDVEKQQMASCVKGAIEGLPPLLRDVYLSREIKGLSAEATAKQLGITIAAVKSRLHRARLLVREILDQSVCAPESFAQQSSSA